MKQVYKQMIVMLFATAFMLIVAMMVLSSTASAQATHTDRTDDMLQSADDHLADQKPHVTGTFSGECTPTHHTVVYFSDAPVVYDSNQAEIDRLEGELEALRYEIATNNGYDTDYSDRITNGIYALIIIAIIGFILYAMFGEHIETSKPRGIPKPYIPDADKPDAQPYDRRAAQAEIEDEWITL